MTSDLHDPVTTHSRYLDRLDDVRLSAVSASLRHSAESGWPASSNSVRLLVAYAMGEITSRDYVAGILDESGVSMSPAPAPVLVAVPAPVWAPAPAVTRDEAVAAYVAGRISVEEFLQVTRSHVG